MQLCIEKGNDYLIQGGSYVGQIRKQLPNAMIMVNRPWTRPLAPILPPGIPAPTTDNKILSYFCEYLMGHGTGSEVYTYGKFIMEQYSRIIVLLIESNGATNQATIAIGDSSTTFLDDPPCLRSISFKVVDGRLQMSLFFRSWDLFAGMPENLGGLQLLKEDVLSEIQPYFPVTDGPIVAYSDGLHLYEQYNDIVDRLNVQKISLSSRVLEEKQRFIVGNGV
jgi:thymidylate synthase